MNALMIDPRTSAFFRPQDAGSGVASLGSGNGAGFLNGLSTLPGAEAYMLPDGGINPDALQAYLEANGLQLMADGGGDAEQRWVQNAAGDMVVQPERFSYNADDDWYAAALAAGATAAGLAVDPNLSFLGGASGGAGGAGVAGGGLTAPAGFTLAPGLGAGAAGAGAAGASGGLGLPGFLSSPGFWGPAVSAGIGLFGQKQAIDAAKEGNQAQLGLLRELNAQNRADNAPLLALRNETLPKINALMSDPSSVQNDPGYQFGLNQGNNLLANRAAASGNYYSGGQLKAAQKFGQDYAGTKLTDSLNRLMGVAGLGQVGATQQQNANTNFGTQAGNALMTGGNIRGSGYMGMTNTVGGAVNDWFNNWQRQNGGG